MIRAIIVFITLTLAACDPAPSEPTNTGRYTVVTTVGMIADITRNLAGEHASVENIIGEGVDPHLYKPTRDDILQLQNADLILYNGLHLEGKMGDILQRIASADKPVHAVADTLLQRDNYVLNKPGGQAYDPHVWMDVNGWIAATHVVADALIAHDPDHEPDYRNNLNNYLTRLNELENYARTSLATIPDNQRVLITAHDAFGYLGRAYGIEVLGIQGLSTESEAGLRDIERLIKTITQRNIPAVFVETSISDKNVRALVEGAQAAGHTVTIGGELFSDAMGPADTYEGTYIGMIDHNITTITRALGGNAPAKGLHGRLNTHHE
ncbi:metal ABC transporter solute-binding protein, Zn/Mn family [Mucisphaera calidilacus]|uniref:Periplasmic zinc-binding protein TroA n=1 Tax=Mucisphaera calidilacus TaxID=2527982 RepID=A0A518C005_9BACT|nr:zinc ABC transporter substrate-binding protein [Mucisphaera calidilacus]QDU72556.1 Periplasmic zinc-binding protein TroA precursor [Mucisphaera calidilacus]